MISKLFNNIGRADELGSGMRNLYKYTKMYSNSEPVLFKDDAFKVEVPLSAICTADKNQQSIILEFIKENGSICNAEA